MHHSLINERIDFFRGESKRLKYPDGVLTQFRRGSGSRPRGCAKLNWVTNAFHPTGFWMDGLHHHLAGKCLGVG